MKSHIGAALLVLFFTGLVQAQTIERSLDSDEYQKAIDILFPLDGGEVPAFADYKIVLRVRPSFEAEYSISFAARGDSVHVTLREAADGNLFYFLSSLVKTTELLRADELSRRAHIRVTSTTIPRNSFHRYRRAFDLQVRRILSDSVSGNSRAKLALRANEARIALDGTNYDVRFVNASMDEIRLSVYDQPLAATKFDHELVKWIKSVVRFVANNRTFSRSDILRQSLKLGPKHSLKPKIKGRRQ